jgi:hypothetical protein
MALQVLVKEFVGYSALFWNIFGIEPHGIYSR